MTNKSPSSFLLTGKNLEDQAPPTDKWVQEKEKEEMLKRTKRREEKTHHQTAGFGISPNPLFND